MGFFVDVYDFFDLDNIFVCGVFFDWLCLFYSVFVKINVELIN